MLDYTKAALKKTADDFKKLDYVRNLATQILYAFYLIYAIIAGAGRLWANILLLCLALGYLVVFLFVTSTKPSENRKKLKKITWEIFTRTKQLIKFFNLVVMVYGIYATTTHVTALSVVLSAFMIVGFILQLIFEVVFKFFLNRAQFIIEGMEADYENMVKPVKTVGNFFKKMAGKEIEPEKEKSKMRLWLDDKVAQNKQEKKQKKRNQRLEKRQKRTDEKNTVYVPKQTEEELDLVPAPTLIEETEPPLALPEAKTKGTNKMKTQKGNEEK